MRLPILIFHISAGLLGLLSGAAAMSFRKGSQWHRLSGNAFVVSMMGMGAAGSYLALMKHQMNNVFGGLLAIYMVATAWASGRRRERSTVVLDRGALMFALVVGAIILAEGVKVARGPAAPADGVPAGMYFFMGAVTLLSAAGDVRMMVRGKLSGVQRVTRHLWRMCFALFMASGSFFLGQQQVFPTWLQGSSLLFVPALLPLGLLIFWIIRVRFVSAYKKIASVAGDAALSTS